MRKAGKRSSIIAVIAAIGLIAAVAGYAYWTSGGSGSGTATAGTTTDNLTITATGWAGIAPGAANAEAFTVRVTNPNSYAVHVNNVVLDTSFGGGTGVTTDNAGCLSSWFLVDTASITPNTNVAAGGNTGDLAFGSLTMSDLLATNQDACKSPTQITLHFTSN